MKTISSIFYKRNQTVAVPEVLEASSGALEVIEILTDNIVPNPFQPRKIFAEEALSDLMESIREFGVIQPLIVRQTEAGFELIAGERRLRASKMAGRESVPCIIRQADDKEMAEIAMIENLQRQDLHYFEEAAGYEKLLIQFGLTQDLLAARVGKDQSTIANKMRLLKLSPKVRDFIYREKLTERHSRALLKIDSEQAQFDVLQAVVEQKMNVRETEAFIGEKMQQGSELPPRARRQNLLKIVKDVRIFINTIGELVAQMKKTGLDVSLRQEQDDDFVTITMVVPKRRS